MSSSAAAKDSASPSMTLQTVMDISKELGIHYWVAVILLDYHGERGVRVGKRRLIDPATKERLVEYVATYQGNFRRIRAGA